MRPFGASRALALVAFVVSAGCRQHGTAPAASSSAAIAPSAAPSASVRTTTSASAAASHSLPHVRFRGALCRVLGVKASKPPPPGTPSLGATFGGQAWLELASGVEVSLKHSETLRELRLVGPGRFLACPSGEEEIVVARGTVVTTPGPGSRAGAEVALATPFGVALYADAALELNVTADKLTLTVKQGEATLNDTTEASVHDEAPVQHVKPTDRSVSVRGKVDADALATSCDAAKLEAVTPPPADREARGAWASNMLEWHRRVRLRCARAAAAGGRLDHRDEARLEDLLEERKSPAPPAASTEMPAETDAGK